MRISDWSSDVCSSDLSGHTIQCSASSFGSPSMRWPGVWFGSRVIVSSQQKTAALYYHSHALLLRHGRDFRHIRDSAIVRGMVQRGPNVLDIALDALAFDAFRWVVIVLTLPRNSLAMQLGSASV